MQKTFIANCPVCGKEFSVSSSWNGKEIQCPGCRSKFTAQMPVSDSNRKEMVKDFVKEHKKIILKITGILIGVIILITGCCKAYSIYQEQAEARRIAKEKEEQARRIENEKNEQKRMVEKLRKYATKSKRNPHYIIRKIFVSYNTFFQSKKIKYVEDSIEDILSERFIMDLPPTKEKEEDFRKRINTETADRFPLSEDKYREKMEKEAEMKYKMLNYGDTITVYSPRFKPFKGKFYGFNTYSKSIRVNSRVIAIIDLSDDTLAQIDKTFNAQIKRKFVDNECKRYHDSIIQFADGLKKKLMSEQGYINILGRYYSPKEYLEKLQDECMKPKEEVPKKKENEDEELESSL